MQAKCRVCNCLGHERNDVLIQTLSCLVFQKRIDHVRTDWLCKLDLKKSKTSQGEGMGCSHFYKMKTNNLCVQFPVILKV